MVSITGRLQRVAKTPLGSTQCHYVSADGDESVTTVGEVHMASVVGASQSDRSGRSRARGTIRASRGV